MIHSMCTAPRRELHCPARSEFGFQCCADADLSASKKYKVVTRDCQCVTCLLTTSKYVKESYCQETVTTILAADQLTAINLQGPSILRTNGHRGGAPALFKPDNFPDRQEGLQLSYKSP